MDSWKTLAIAVLASVSTQAFAEDRGSYQNSMFLVLLAPTVTIAATTGLTMLAANNFNPAKADALAFIGSDGEIRGAQFEQAVRYYRTTYSPPLMTDHQLALAIATTF